MGCICGEMEAVGKRISSAQTSRDRSRLSVEFISAQLLNGCRIRFVWETISSFSGTNAESVLKLPAPIEIPSDPLMVASEVRQSRGVGCRKLTYRDPGTPV